MKNTTFDKIANVRFAPILLVITCLLVIPNSIVLLSCRKHLYSEMKLIPHNKVGLLLGTSRYLSDGRRNPYYEDRIDAAAALFRAGKIDFILVSGDKRRNDFDEPSTMKQDLIDDGIPESKILLDYAGFRTLDSVVRCKTIYGQDSITVISQAFHNERAIYLAQKHGIKAIGFDFEDISAYFGFKTQLLERLTRVKMMIELIIGKKPKSGGEKIIIE